MQAHARLSHDIAEGVRLSAVETIEQRITRTLDNEASGATYIVRPTCIIATMFLSGICTAQPVIEVICPNDELRRSQLAPALLSGGTDRIFLYSLAEEVYEAFARQMKQAGRGIGEYTLFTRRPGGGWNIQEFD